MKHKDEQKFRATHSFVKDKFNKLEVSNNSKISEDNWSRAEGGGGTTYVIADGDFFDNCAVNFSSIYGKKLPNAALAKTLNKEVNFGYQAAGISVISHPKNPHIPTSHMNIRIFGILDKDGLMCDWWIGGGYDLTPFLPYKEDIIGWHNDAKKFLEPYGANFYKDFSENCNNYFNIPHRNERRGVGGIFFDNLKNFSSIDLGISFLQSMAVTYIESYIKIIKRRRNSDYSEAQKEFQLLRRGRYAEFNLVYDRGTAFGLESNGRIESILSSLPSNVKWSYKKSEEYNLLEKKLLEHINRDWNV
tara:strand:- start:2354 stop:3262 length:909 start_codon:yes stop_codon:yes gene_type:complete